MKVYEDELDIVVVSPGYTCAPSLNAGLLLPSQRPI
jgi:hypothetical protein